jgi:hypothetical protein
MNPTCIEKVKKRPVTSRGGRRNNAFAIAQQRRNVVAGACARAAHISAAHEAVSARDANEIIAARQGRICRVKCPLELRGEALP